MNIENLVRINVLQFQFALKGFKYFKIITDTKVPLALEIKLKWDTYARLWLILCLYLCTILGPNNKTSLPNYSPCN